MDDAPADARNRHRPVDRPAAVCGAAWLALALLATLSILDLQPRRVEPEDADPARFSAARAMAHVRAVGGEPRPSGSPAHERAREYVVATLRGLGLTPAIRTSEAISTRYGIPFDSATVANVMARMEGAPGAGEILLVAHYDTVPTSPGAGDDLAGVATLLEAARALATSPPGANVAFLFTDAEEIGAVGAERFVAESGSRPDRVVVNFDARGTRGPCALVEAGPESAAFVRALSTVGFTPAATSLAPALARFHGLGTDFRPFREAGGRGLNFALLDGVAYYHTPRDDVATLDPRSLQQQGEIAVALVRAIGDPRATGADRNAVFFPVAGWGLVWLPAWAELACALAATLLGLLVGVRTWRSRAIRARTLAAAAGALALVPIAAGVVGEIVWLGVRWLDPTWSALRTADTYAPGSYRLAAVLAAAAVALACGRVVVTRVGLQTVALAVVGLLLALTWLCVVSVPGAAYLFAAPALLLPIALVALEKLRVGGWARGVLAVGVAVPVVLLWAPVPYFVLVALQLSAAPGAALAVAIPVLVLVSLFESAGLSFAWSPAVAAVAAIALFGYGVATARFDAARPRPISLAFAEDTDARRAFWIADRARDDAATADYFSSPIELAELPPFFGESDTVARASETAGVGIAGPEVSLLGDTMVDGRRTLTLRLRSRRGAPWLFAFLDSEARVLETAIDGAPASGREITDAPPDGVRWGFRHVGLREEGIEWTVVLATSDEPVRIVVVDQTTGLPARDGEVAPLPNDLVFARSWVSGTTLARTVATY